jgi:hypothetical protein
MLKQGFLWRHVRTNMERNSERDILPDLKFSEISLVRTSLGCHLEWLTLERTSFFSIQTLNGMGLRTEHSDRASSHFNINSLNCLGTTLRTNVYVTLFFDKYMFMSHFKVLVRTNLGLNLEQMIL